MEDLLRVCDLHVSIDLPNGPLAAVRGIGFRIRPGSTVALVGESGAGKSIAAHAILGLLPRQARIAGGSILFADPSSPGIVTDLSSLPSGGRAMRRIRGRRISMIFQEPMSSLSPLHSIGNQVSEALRLHADCPPREIALRTRAMLDRVGFPDPERAARAYPFELSGGLRQRAMIAMALICRPALLIADEPTTALDVTTQAQILHLIAEMQHDLGMAVLIITHDLGVVANMAEEIVVLHRGEVMEAGTRDDIFHRPGHPYLRGLLGAVPRLSADPGVRLRPLRGASRAVAPKPAARPIGAPLLVLRDLSKTFRERSGVWEFRRRERTIPAVDGVSLEIHRGEALGLVGESGSGKSTLAKLILRAVPPDGGDVFYCGDGERRDVLAFDREALTRYRRKVQYIFQDPFASLDPRMTVLDIVTEPLAIHRVGTTADRRERARALMRLVGLDERMLSRYPHSFSGGQRQRLGIARALALGPELLICDEPVSALDVGIQAQILNLLKDLQGELGLTYLFVSHNLAVVNYIADRIAVMWRGRIVELAPRKALFQRPLHPYTRTLLAAVPDIDPERRLDLALLCGGETEAPDCWPAAFRGDGSSLALRDCGDGHLVRAAAGLDPRELVA